MQNFLIKTFVLMLSLMLVNFSSAKTLDFDVESSKHKFPDWFVDNSFLDLEEATAEASSENKKGLMVLFTTQGCSYCDHFIKTSLGNPDIAAKVQQKFASIGMEIFDDAEMVTPSGESKAVKHFAVEEGVGFAPTLLFYDDKGKRVLRQVGYQSPKRFQKLMDYVSGNHYQSQSLRDFIASRQEAKPAEITYAKLKDDALFDSPPYALDRSKFAASEPLMVLFEKKGCNECDQFHKRVMTLKDVRGLMQNFQVVRMDIDDNKTPVLLPDGKRSTPADWYQQSTFSRLPALTFYSEEGKLSMKTDAYVLHNRMINLLKYMQEKAHLKNMTYQQFARSKAIKRSLKKAD